jgi:hypothetical protein
MQLRRRANCVSIFLRRAELGRLYGALICDGTSDRALSSVAERVAKLSGFSLDVEVVDFAILRPGLSLKSRLRALPELVASPSVILIHRDAENQPRADRVKEMRAALAESQFEIPYVPIVPVRMTEAWLLCDEAAIRNVSGNPKSKPLLLPSNPETISDPKSRLQDLILESSQQTGRKRAQLSARFSELRRQLLETLDVGGPVTKLTSFSSFCKDLNEALSKIV